MTGCGTVQGCHCAPVLSRAVQSRAAHRAGGHVGRTLAGRIDGPVMMLGAVATHASLAPSPT